MSDDEGIYEETARLVAEKVKRQQDGVESALLSSCHEDETYRTVDEIQALLVEQRGSASRFSFMSRGPASNGEIARWYTERSKYIPVRLTFEERVRLRLVQALMKSSDYTDLVDGVEHKSSARRMMRQVKCIQAILVGIATSLKYDKAQALVHELDFHKYEETFAGVFETGRRYKVMNPEKMRGVYGKMIFMLQDAVIHDIMEGLQFSLVRPMKTVYSVLQDRGALDALKSEWISTATMEILPENKSRSQIQKEIRAKEQAIEHISRSFSSNSAEKEEIKQCLHSIADNSSYLNSNCKPIDFIIDLLKQFFANPPEEKWSLAIYGGESGSRLTHTHERQYHYVLQSLTLWREIVHDMFRLWYVAEQDLLDPESSYKLKNTGQGVNRLQAAPRTSKAMHGILYAVQQKLGHTVEGWVGSSVIHLGDTNVPNSLVFIDKYNQVPRVLNPIVQCLKYTSNALPKDQALTTLVQQKYGSIENAQRAILHDFFRHAFDGSGADNFFEAGSCIDGRLTSAWNWCQQLPTKDYYFLFKLSGFLGFDGDFQT
mmetsp:Transcript_6230/g.9842  ORF Transcript_6230/g.9842 Transcript_6230/m.9842 type:complete len:544 (+) Transcript_6230:128-1759(+)|eukprot:CAMPEP_0203753234 /NCGR_PEP_ID=MMETSP0098-20131031/7029_1 /ASSEMBLY_ACC=CAM_ASM_000208 /TAXON_ID=96639 /ORGANISM=" , Strain NY0313808BC1" /LENGTH=543 /DNA_ID=CAMNT_0050643737 /DNA_START=174 /DNA_END=1805 /DNA_ORIENTATION=+